MQPQFVLKQNPMRIVVPEMFKIIGLCVIFYLGIMLNLYLLRYEATDEIIFGIIGFCILLILSHAIFTYIKSKKVSYNFYPDRIERVGKDVKTIYLYTIIRVDYERTYLDKIFNTINILLKPDFRIDHVKDSNQILYYIQNLINYARK